MAVTQISSAGDGRRLLVPPRRQNDPVNRSGAAIRCGVAAVALGAVLVILAERAPVAGTPTRAPAPTFPVIYEPVAPEDLGR
jgi:hypothetical protein